MKKSDKVWLLYINSMDEYSMVAVYSEAHKAYEEADKLNNEYSTTMYEVHEVDVK